MSKKIIRGSIVSLLLVSAFCLSTLSASAGSTRVIEIRKKAELNPTIRLNSTSGSEILNNELRNFLAVCGWFDVTDNDNADYVLQLSTAGSVNFTLLQGKNPIASWKIRNHPNQRSVAKTVVDTTIEYLFKQLKVRGFCHSRIAFCAETAPGIRNVYLCDIDGRELETLTNYRTLNVEPCWSPDARTVCFSKYGKSGIDIVETTIRKPRMSRILSSFNGINTGAAISPDGKYMAAILSPDHKVDLYLLGLHRKERRRLTRGIAVEASPCWSPDGKQLAFVSDRNGSPRIFVIDASGRNMRMLPVVPGGVDAVTPAWSGDDKIAYATRLRRGGSYVLAVYNLVTGENKVVTTGSGSWESPGWAADNRQVVCKRTLNGKSSLYIVDTKTGRERMLLRTGTQLFDPAWSPCLKK